MKQIIIVIVSTILYMSMVSLSVAEPTVCGSPRKFFIKEDFSDWTIAQNQDRITNSVWLTRQNQRGLFNIQTDGNPPEK